MAEYRLSNTADADLLGIAHYTMSQFGRRQAMTYSDGFAHCFEMISENPKIGRTLDTIRLGLRCFNYKSHGVYYMETDLGVLVVRVLHERQDAGAYLE